MTVRDYFDFTHDSDRQALRSLEAIPGFKPALKAFMRAIGDRQFHMENMSQKVLLGPNQLSRIYDLLPPICDRFGIETPPLFLEYDPYQNAYTWGDNIPFITVTSGLLENMNDEEIQIVLAHECGHIVCHHVLYHTMGNIIMNGAAGALGIPIVSTALSAAFAYWMRCSEFSADRAAALFCSDAEKVANIMLRLSGVSKELLEEVSLEAFMSQAASYYEFKNSSDWNSFLNFATIAFYDHPLNAVRAAEIMAWAEQPDFAKVCEDLDNGAGQFTPMRPMMGTPNGIPNGAPGATVPNGSTVCPNCSASLSPGVSFCPICGTAIASPKQHCTRCGTALDPSASFCNNCGAPCNQTTRPEGMQPMQPMQPTYGMSPQKSSTNNIRQNLQNAFKGAENAATNAFSNKNGI